MILLSRLDVIVVLHYSHISTILNSGEGTSEYDDQSGMMGYSYSNDDGPEMCFNAGRSSNTLHKS